MLNIVLVNPEIPQNAGNILRTAIATEAVVHFISPFSFSLDQAHLRRACLDYYPKRQVVVWESVEDFFKENGEKELFLFTKKAKKIYTDIGYRDKEEIFLVFGKESSGLDSSLLSKYPDRLLRIPTSGSVRSLNLSNAVAVSVYEVLRQKGFDKEWL